MHSAKALQILDSVFAKPPAVRCTEASAADTLDGILVTCADWSESCHWWNAFAESRQRYIRTFRSERNFSNERGDDLGENVVVRDLK
jgi:hypothetical protein